MKETPAHQTTMAIMDLKKAKIAIVGAGAVGGYYGARLAQHGYDVHFLLRSDYKTVRAHGWKIKSCNGDFEVPANRISVYDRAAEMPKADLVIVTLKSTSNADFEPLIRPLLQESTARS